MCIFAPGQYITVGRVKFWGGLYNVAWALGQTAKVVEIWREHHKDLLTDSDFIFDFMPAQITNNARIEVQPGETLVVPVAATLHEQRLYFADDKRELTVIPGQYEWTFFRCPSAVSITSPQNFAVAEPIVLQHRRENKKLVLALKLADLNSKGYEECHRLRKILRSRVHFARSLANIPWRQLPLYLRQRGYYCVNLAAAASAVVCGENDAFSRIVGGGSRRSAAIAHRIVEHVEAFSECDNFVAVNIAAHFASPYRRQLVSQTKKLFTSDQSAALTDFERKSIIEQTDYWCGLMFDYLEKHYRVDEYSVLICAEEEEHYAGI